MKFFHSILFVFTAFICFNANAQLKCGTYDDFDARFYHIGAFHNAHLSNMLSAFNVPAGKTSYEEAINTIASFNEQFTMNMQQKYTDIPPDPAVNNAAY